MSFEFTEIEAIEEILYTHRPLANEIKAFLEALEPQQFVGMLKYIALIYTLTGFDDGYQTGSKKGFDAGFSSGRQRGSEDGYKAGFEAGCYHLDQPQPEQPTTAVNQADEEKPHA
jgi:flagellar biosynthesis/type III secretory pathway protein FliH